MFEDNTAHARRKFNSPQAGVRTNAHWTNAHRTYAHRTIAHWTNAHITK